MQEVEGSSPIIRLAPHKKYLQMASFSPIGLLQFGLFLPIFSPSTFCTRQMSGRNQFDARSTAGLTASGATSLCGAAVVAKRDTQRDG